jgi:iron complex outermembrane recepter protein
MTTTRLLFESSIGNRAAVVFGTALVAGTGSALAQQPAGTLQEVVVTAQRHEQNVQDVPISVSALSGERLAAMFEGGDDIRALATRVPSLYAESSNGRLAPRFYIRGLGNTDFDLAASQPVSIIVDDVVLENVVLKSFPLFDIQRVEVLRGPQGTLFGRNTPAGIVKFDTNKPSSGFDADFGVSYGELETTTVEGAVGGGSDRVSGRVSFLYHERADWIDNNSPFSAADTPTGKDAMGGFEEYAYRGQLLLSPSDDLSFLFNIHGREMSNGTAAIFRANVLGPGSDGFNSNYDRDSVTFDEGRNNPQEASGLGASLKIDWTFGNQVTLTSVSAWESTDDKSEGDIDGGFGADFLVPFGVPEGPCPPGHQPGQTCIPFPSHSQDGIDDLDQYTQEIRFAQQATDAVFWQGGVYYFDSKFTVTTFPFFVPPTTVEHKNTAWAAFAHVSVDVTDAWNITGGVRYTDDDKDFRVISTPYTIAVPPPVSVQDSKFSWDLSALYKVNDGFSVYGRVADGFRAPTIQGRDVAFGTFGVPGAAGAVSTADSETIRSGEIGFKSELAGNRVRLSGAVFYYEIKDQQLSAIGGGGNFIRLVNADKGTGKGFEIEGDFRPTDNLEFTLGYSYVDTEFKDNTLVVPPCGSGLCTVTDPLDANGNAIIDGNPFPQAPKYIATVTARYGIPIGNGELFFYTDWAFQGETNFFIYESKEFKSDNTYEGGARIGYAFNQGKYELAVYGRNITDEENVKGGIDFNNLTGFDNDPRVVGVSFNAHF